MSTLSGPQLVPQQPQYAVILLHGYGADGQNLLDLAYFFERLLPAELFNNIAWFAPNAPNPTPYNQGYEWFDLSDGRFADQPGLDNSRQKLAEHITHLQQTHGFKSYILLGFSQGGMTSLYSAQHLPLTPAGIISYAGMLLFPEAYPPQPKPIPHLILHGEADPVVPPQARQDAANFLTNRQIPTEHHGFPAVEHFIAPDAMPIMAKFIEQQFS